MAEQKTVRIGTRGSPLALAQANLFADMVAKASPGAFATSIHPYTTTGDKILDKPLQDAGGKGLFTKELDRAQETGEIDVAVHSLKDLTVKLEPHLMLAAYLPREDPHDCLIGPWARIADLPRGAVVGTSSLRRKAQLLAARPDLEPITFRGNVQTRLRKLAEGEAQATILAAAGLRRLACSTRRPASFRSRTCCLQRPGHYRRHASQGCAGLAGIRRRRPPTTCLAARRRRRARFPPASRRFMPHADRRTFQADRQRRLDGRRSPVRRRRQALGAREGSLEHKPRESEAEAFGLLLAEEVAAKREADLR